MISRRQFLTEFATLALGPAALRCIPSAPGAEESRGSQIQDRILGRDSGVPYTYTLLRPQGRIASYGTAKMRHFGKSYGPL